MWRLSWYLKNHTFSLKMGEFPDIDGLAILLVFAISTINHQRSPLTWIFDNKVQEVLNYSKCLNHFLDLKVSLRLRHLRYVTKEGRRPPLLSPQESRQQLHAVPAVVSQLHLRMPFTKQSKLLILLNPSPEYVSSQYRVWWNGQYHTAPCMAQGRLEDKPRAPIWAVS